MWKRENNRFAVICLIMASILSICLLLADSCIPAYADEPEEVDWVRHPIDAQMRDALNVAQSTADMANAAYQAWDQWDAEIDAVYKELAASLAEEERALLCDAERKWVEYKTAELRLYEVVRPPQGTMYIPMVADSKMNVVRGRALKLIFYNDCLKKAEGKNLLFDMHIPEALQSADMAELETTLAALYERLRLSIEDRQLRRDGDYDQKVEDGRFLYHSQEKWEVFRDAEFKFLDTLAKKKILSAALAEECKRETLATRAAVFSDCLYYITEVENDNESGQEK